MATTDTHVLSRFRLGSSVRTGLASVVGAAVLAAAAFPTMAQPQATTFTILIENVSSDTALKLPDGTAVKVPIAPGVFAVYSGTPPMFQVGKPAGSKGLEALMEDGESDALAAHLQTVRNVNASGVFFPGSAFTIEARPGDRLSFAAIRAVERPLLRSG